MQIEVRGRGWGLGQDRWPGNTNIQFLTWNKTKIIVIYLCIHENSARDTA